MDTYGQSGIIVPAKLLTQEMHSIARKNMKSHKVWTACLLIAGLNCLAMAIVHFALPFMFDWSEKLASVHPIFPWALDIINFSWSLMLLLLTFLVIRIALKGPGKSLHETSLIVGLGIYWFIHAVYLFTSPPPMPPHLIWLRWILLAFPITVCSLHFFPVWYTRTKK